MSYSQEVAIKIENLSKSYKMFETPGKRLLYYLIKVRMGHDFWALSDINFEINKGETFGIIGKNGSGKSTLLQILAGILKQSEGNITVNGKIAALLELGSGFNPEYTGYENIYMNAAILGVSKEKIDEKVNDIIGFADIGDFINQPVKTYSSGMFIRLAFSVAINVDADIILIDEALAVGDVFFRQKCYSKLNKLKEQGKTIILVTHAMNEVEQFCDRAVLIHNGQQMIVDNSKNVVQQYYLINQEGSISMLNDNIPDDNKVEENTFGTNNIFFDSWKIRIREFFDITDALEHGNGKAKYVNVGIFDEKGYPKRVFNQGEIAYFYTEIFLNQTIDKPIWGVVLFDQRNNIVFGKNTLQTYTTTPNEVKAGTSISMCIKVKLDVAIGEYTFETGFVTMDEKYYSKRDMVSQEELDEVTERIAVLTNIGSFAVHGNNIGKPTKLLFHGMCNLSCDMDININ